MLGSFYKTFKASPEEKEEELEKTIEKIKRSPCITVEPPIWENGVTPLNLERIYWLRDHGYWPYVMLYDKEHLQRGCDLKKLQRWVNNRFIFAKVKTFEEYRDDKGKE